MVQPVELNRIALFDFRELDNRLSVIFNLLFTLIALVKEVCRYLTKDLIQFLMINSDNNNAEAG